MRLWVEGRGHEERYYFTGNRLCRDCWVRCRVHA